MTTIIIGEEAINNLDNEKIHDWLNKRESHLFQVWLVSETARLTAEAGNKLVSGEESDLAESKLLAEDARKYSKLADILATMRDPDKAFTAVTLKPQPIIANV